MWFTRPQDMGGFSQPNVQWGPTSLFFLDTIGNYSQDGSNFFISAGSKKWRQGTGNTFGTSASGSLLIEPTDMNGFYYPFPPKTIITPPVNSISPGELRQFAIDGNFFYYCTGNGAWRRIVATHFGPPENISGLQARWVAYDLLTSLSYGDDVLTLYDGSGNGNTATNANTAGNRPTFVQGAVNGGRPAIASTSSQAGKSMQMSTLPFTSPFTLVLVFKYTGTAPTGETGIMGIASGISDGMRTGMTSNNAWEYTVASVGNFLTVNSAVTDNVWHWMIMVVDSSASPKVSIYVDNPTTALTWSNAPTGIMTSTNQTGFIFGSSGNQNSNNQVAECMVFNTSLGSTDRQTIQTYMQQAYGFS